MGSFAQATKAKARAADSRKTRQLTDVEEKNMSLGPGFCQSLP